MAVLTTSRNPSKATRNASRQLAKKLGLEYFSRGRASISGLAEKARFVGEKKIIIVNESGGKPGNYGIVDVGKGSCSYSKKIGGQADLIKFMKK